MSAERRPADLEQLRSQVERGEVDTVLLAITDMQGRLQGKRLTATHFLDEVAEHGAEGCNYLLAVDVDMATVDGYAMSSWERGYGDMLLRPRPGHAARGALAGGNGRRAWPTSPGWTARTSWPRRARCCAASSARLAERGWSANAGTELEFIVFRDTYEEAWQQGVPRAATRPTSTTSTTRCWGPRASSR